MGISVEITQNIIGHPHVGKPKITCVFKTPGLSWAGRGNSKPKHRGTALGGVDKNRFRKHQAFYRKDAAKTTTLERVATGQYT